MRYCTCNKSERRLYADKCLKCDLPVAGMNHTHSNDTALANYKISRYGSTYGVFENTNTPSSGRLLCCFVAGYGISAGPGLGKHEDKLINAIPVPMLRTMIAKSIQLARGL